MQTKRDAFCLAALNLMLIIITLGILHFFLKNFIYKRSYMTYCLKNYESKIKKNKDTQIMTFKFVKFKNDKITMSI